MRSASLLALAILVPASLSAQLTVAQDGTGQFSTVQAAVDAAPSHSRARTVIHLKPGIYRERVVVSPDKALLSFEGEDPRTTVITAGIHAGMPGPDGKPLITFGTPTVFIQANDFMAENLTFENSAGPQGQALALTIMGDRGIFRNCRFLGYQDTLLAQAGRQWFDHCYIEGAVDFIFGGSAAWFEACEIHIKANGYIAAPNTPKDQHYGYVFSNCRITSQPDVHTYLGRPWRPYAYAVYLNTEMSEAVRPERWNNWNDPAREKTARFSEYHSTGPGGEVKPRPDGLAVPWAHRLTEAEVRQLSLETVLAGADGWNPRTGAIRSPVTVTREAAPSKAAIPRDTVWLATTVSRNPDEPAGLAQSTDGYRWIAIATHLPAFPGGQRQMLDPKLIAPKLIQGPDGIFHLIWATARKGDKGFGYASSKNLLDWSEPAYIPVMAKQDALDLTSPSLFYDEVSRRFVATWASTISRNFIQSFQEAVEDNPRLWYATTRDFTYFSDPELLFDPNYSVRDGVILEDAGRYLLIHNDNTLPMLNLRVSAASTPFGPWGPSSDAFTEKFTDSPAAIQSGHEWWIYYTNAQTGSIGLVKTRDFRSFQDAASPVSFPVGCHPVSILAVRKNAVR